MQKAAELQVYIIVKGHRTLVATPEGIGYFNMSGNPGMATAGSGDVLTGILTGLLAQGYTPLGSLPSRRLLTRTGWRLSSKTYR